MMAIARPLRQALGYLLDEILPHRCLGCAVMIDAEASLCADCWRQLTLIGSPFCRLCGYPLPQVVAAAPLILPSTIGPGRRFATMTARAA
jgi:predicted amidophosphoribosyltransferase